MAESIIINKSNSTEEIYKALLPQINSLLNPNEPLISNLSNVTAALKDAFDKISWVGFYFLKEATLFLGPFQGKVACTSIQFGKGVCGIAAEKKETIIVEDVEKFPGHIACDANSKSEIVAPLTENQKVFGVLDIDSYSLAAFNSVDKYYIETLCKTLVKKLDFKLVKQILS
ncbi:GAF domain-containing protein [Melioribacteraceae bacterium 4301-Me]|uniref:GAF domain-containing protein n=1 Tax=Pyranulibacter aquaticus TaxID=3163344 RepID=UPI00359A2F8E